MKTIITFLVLIVLSGTLFSQGLTISSGTTFSGGSAKIYVSGNWNNQGTFSPGSSTIIFNGASGNQTITKAGGESFNNLTVNKAANNVLLANNITVTGTLTCTSSDLDLNGNLLTLSGTLNETPGNTVKGSSGYITCTSNLNAPSGVNPHGIGLTITSQANLEGTSVKRGHQPQSSSGSNGINRYFEIIPTNNTSLNATLVFHYDESELNSIDESTFEMFTSEDNGASWHSCPGTLNTENNTYTITGVNSFSRFTLASSSAPLPVELISFTAASTGSTSPAAVELKWTTATEVNNYGFEVERTIPPLNPLPEGEEKEWNFLGFVEGHGNSNSPKEYEYVDNLSSATADILDLDPSLSHSLEYRLKQIDTDGSYTYYNQTAKVDVQITDVDNYDPAANEPTEFELKQNYPNPFNPNTTIQYSIPVVETGRLARPLAGATSQHVTLTVYDMLGRKVATLVNQNKSAGTYTVNFNASKLPSGTYMYKIEAGSFIETKKMTLIK